MRVPLENMRLYTDKGDYAVIPGEYLVYVGGSSPLQPLGALPPPLEGILVIDRDSKTLTQDRD